jgi:hypothetical protein
VWTSPCIMEPLCIMHEDEPVSINEDSTVNKSTAASAMDMAEVARRVDDTDLAAIAGGEGPMPP